MGRLAEDQPAAKLGREFMAHCLQCSAQGTKPHSRKAKNPIPLQGTIVLVSVHHAGCNYCSKIIISPVEIAMAIQQVYAELASRQTQ